MVLVDGKDLQEQQRQEDETTNAGKQQAQSEAEPLKSVPRILQSLEETISHSVQAVKDAVIGAGVEDLEVAKDVSPSSSSLPQDTSAKEADSPGGKSLLQSVEDRIVQSVQSVEETISQSVQTVKDAVNAATEAAVSPAAGPKNPEESPKDSTAVVDEAAILVHSVVQD